MLTLIERSERKLQHYQALVDIHWRESKCDESVLIGMSQVKIGHEDLMKFYLNEYKKLTELMTNVVTGWQYCLEMYQKIYAMSARLPTLKLLTKERLEQCLSHIPIDPSSSLNIIDPSKYLTITLFNDNESLFKYDTSKLVEESVGEEIVMVESYYKEECSKMAILLEKLVFVRECERMSQTQSLIREQFLIALRSLSYSSTNGEDDDDEEEKKDLLESVLKVEKEWHQMRENMKPYVFNLVAKFTESSRLMDNLFRAYHLTKSRKKSPFVDSIF